ncbi:hypothetical protein [Kitasatospora azatica]|uniref:hypothetical protein n=1 Tax=Kitasatospora azatica TaxID=58347 RepID=UPI00056B7C3B|nr:hypothetical protein [Kitasatospora azatica]
MSAFSSLSNPEQAQWLAERLTARQIPAATTPMGGGLRSALVELTVSGEAHQLYLSMDDDVLWWQLLRTNGEVVLDSMWPTTPHRAVEHVQRLIRAIGAHLNTGPEPVRAPLADLGSLGGPASAGRRLLQALTTAGLHPRLSRVEPVPSVVVGVGEGGQVLITGRDKTLDHPAAQHTGWTATHSTYYGDELQEIRIYDGQPQHGFPHDTAGCVGAVGALAAIGRHRRTTTIGARIRAALAERGISTGEGGDLGAVVVELPGPDGPQLWISDADGSADEQPQDYYGVQVTYFPSDPTEAAPAGTRELLALTGDERRGLDGLRADLPALLDVVEQALTAADTA